MKRLRVQPFFAFVLLPLAFVDDITPWYSWLIPTIAVVALVLLLWDVMRARTSRLEAERARLEEAVAQRSAELAVAIRELATANAELKEASLTDPLTKLHNRRFFQFMIGADVTKSLRQYADGSSVVADSRARPHFANRDIVFYLIDIDDFKSVNDQYGHPAGDTMLQEVAARINTAMRKSDRLIRWGGEEFLVVSYPTERSEAETLARRIMNHFCREPFELGDSIALRKTCSIGWAPFPWYVDKTEALNYEEVLKLADRALYKAKGSGRNCAVGLFPATTDVETHAPKAQSGSISDRVGVRSIRTPGPAFEAELAESSEGH